MSLVLIFLYPPSKLIARLSIYIIVDIKMLIKNQEHKTIVQWKIIFVWNILSGSVIMKRIHNDCIVILYNIQVKTILND